MMTIGIALVLLFIAVLTIDAINAENVCPETLELPSSAIEKFSIYELWTPEYTRLRYVSDFDTNLPMYFGIF